MAECCEGVQVVEIFKMYFIIFLLLSKVVSVVKPPVVNTMTVNKEQNNRINYI